jgi:hypothetical protein
MARWSSVGREERDIFEEDVLRMVKKSWASGKGGRLMDVVVKECFFREFQALLAASGWDLQTEQRLFLYTAVAKTHSLQLA